MTDHRLHPLAGWAPLPDGLVVALGTWYGVARGGPARRLRERLDGETGAVGLDDRDVRPLLDDLRKAGVVRETVEVPPYAWFRAAENRTGIQGPGRGHTDPGAVAVHGRGDVADTIYGILSRELSGLPVAVTHHVDLPEGGDALAVVVTDEPNASGLGQVNEGLTRSRAPWLLVDLRGAAPHHVGPLIVPGRSGCLDCFRRRRSANVAHPREYELLLRERRSAPPGPWLAHMVAGLAAGVALAWLTGADATLPGSFLELSAGDVTTVTRHRYVPVPGCVVCGDRAPAPAPAPLSIETLVSRQAGPARETVVTRDSTARGVRVTVVGASVDPMHGAVVDVGGEGRCETEAGARVRALAEFAERLVLREPPRSLAGADRPGEPSGCPLSGRLIEAVDLHTGAPVARPAGEFYLHPPGCPVNSRPDRPSSNGAAAGGSADEALERALFELLERDALMVTWRCRLSPPRVAGDALKRELDLLRSRRLEPSLVDLSGIHAVPTVLCVLRGRSAGRPVRAVGSAADRTIERAARRAMGEAAAVYGLAATRQATAPGAPLTFDDYADNAYYHLTDASGTGFDRLDADARSGTAKCPELGGTSAEVVARLAHALDRRGIGVFTADLTPPWLSDRGLRVVVARSPDLYPLELGPGDRDLADRLLRHPCRAVLAGPDGPDLAPVPLA
ncbi:TOMM precursor leader peptide-binding protein [Microbispora sp. ATCC PTA-5024]|uniref:TOMM precursor leader peptide-binding protein n=1 Tax=Microbispora sp. ATCC PTA-5024 TaxID=316330 RepID=UPI0004008590|nr:TOMM precursor leader peptide-binding protein [Microbispora sp. ATCC PTA-5024]